MVVIEFGDYKVPLDERDWRLLTALAGGFEAFDSPRACGTHALTAVPVPEREVVAVALVLEAARLRGELTPSLVSLCKDLFDYADFAAARSMATTMP